MAYTTIDDPTAFFQAKKYVGTGGSQAYTFDGNSDLQADFLWFKSTDLSQEHWLADSVRGTTKYLESNSTNAEATSASGLSSFDSNGFTFGSDIDRINGDGHNYVGWGWKAGTSFTNDASGTGIGTIDSAGSVNTDAGFSIISYTGNGSAGATVAHGLGAVPGIIFIKNRTNGAENWLVYTNKSGGTKAIVLDTTTAEITNSSVWNNTNASSTVFTLGVNDAVNQSSSPMIAYCFTDKQGYSKVGGKYVGNGNANGTFVYTGFKPAMVICKKSSASGTNWGIIDNKRANPFNEISAMLNPNSSGTEGANNDCDFLSNGFKWRTNDGNSNASATYIYMAFAENPFVTSTGVPATAR